MALIKTPFSDQVGPESAPSRGSKGGKYDSEEIPNTPSRDVSPNGYPELHRDTAVTSKSPSVKGPIDSPFDDAVS